MALRLALFALPLLAALPAAAAPPLTGAWTLVRGEQVDADGRTRPLAIVSGAEGARGLIVYAESGWMSVQIAGSGRPVGANQGSGTVRSYDPAAAAKVLGSYYAYYGRYLVDPAAGTVSHMIVDSLHPDETGITYVRRYAVAGDELTLETEPFDVDGDRRYNRLVWKRAR